MAGLVARLVGQHWVDRDGAERPLTAADILVVAPYNAHVAALRRAVPDGVAAGTVDRFQGQEAAVVIYSMDPRSPRMCHVAWSSCTRATG